MPELAQTNIQLCRQLIALGWSDDDLVELRRAYELGMWLFSAQFRANGKTQLAHHVGVASALAASGARPALVQAGLVHSAYFLGEFGNGRLAINPDKRARVRATVGEEVEALVHAYTDTEWNRDAVRVLIRDADACAPVTRDVVAMRLANEVDELADAVGRFCDHHADPGLEGEEGLALLDALADAHGLDELRGLVRAASAEGDATKIPAVLVSDETDSVFVPPASYRRRLHIALQDSRLGHEVAERVPGARELAERIRRAVS